MCQQLLDIFDVIHNQYKTFWHDCEFFWVICHNDGSNVLTDMVSIQTIVVVTQDQWMGLVLIRLNISLLHLISTD